MKELTEKKIMKSKKNISKREREIVPLSHKEYIWKIVYISER